MPFTTDLRQATQAAHQEAEDSSFIALLMNGSLERQDYVRLLEQYLPLYEALETACREAGDVEPLRSFHDPRLDRSAAIRRDVEALGGDVDAPVLPATRAYADRIGEVADQPARLLAHHYLRYLGDLSGGQAIARLVARHYDVEADALSMWDFSELGRPKEIKDSYRALLDTVLTPEQQEQFTDEAAGGYVLARALFEDLGRTRLLAA